MRVMIKLIGVIGRSFLSSALILGEDLNSCGIVMSNPQAKQLYDHKALQ